MRPAKESLQLPCRLTEQELLVYGMRLAEEQPKVELLDNELKEFKDQVNANKSKVVARIADLSNRINLKREYREVECAVKYDFADNLKIWIRLDTNEIVKQETIPSNEYQEELPLETPTKERE